MKSGAAGYSGFELGSFLRLCQRLKGEGDAALLIGSGHPAAAQCTEANQEQVVSTFIPKGGKRTQIHRSFHIHRMEKLIINGEPDMSIVPQGLVGCSVHHV